LERGYLSTRFGQIHYIAGGEGDIVLLIHQSGRSSRMFLNLIGVLGDHFRAIAIDLPGFGNSCSAKDGVTIDDLADLCADVVAALGASAVHVYGHHSGNKIATAFAGRYPNKVKRLVLAGQSHSIIPDQADRNKAIDKFVKPYRQSAEVRDAQSLKAEKWALTYRTIASAWWQPGLLSNPTPQAEALAYALVLDTLQAADGSAKLYSANLNYDLASGYRAIPVETLILEIVTPEEDALIGRQGGAVCALVRNSKLAEIAHEDGDGVTLERCPHELAAILIPFFSQSRLTQIKGADIIEHKQVGHADIGNSCPDGQRTTIGAIIRP
jgi:pimeloyl-ACP methyl ester carboxylesterase